MPILYKAGFENIIPEALTFTVVFSDTSVSEDNNLLYFYYTIVPANICK